jgi:segregation and condensation protein A
VVEVTGPSEDDPNAAALVAPLASADTDGQSGDPSGSTRFTVRLTNFEGPFDLLLQLIGKHKLEITEVSLHTVTDDFIAHIRAMGNDWDLDEVSEFLLIAATLLDLKAARLLPSAEIESEEDLALLEARDLLFARLLQYRAYKHAAAYLAELESTGGRRWPRLVSLEPQFAEALPDLVLGVGPDRLAKLALRAFAPKVIPTVSIAHIHQVRVSVREHAATLRDRLRELGFASFGDLTADCENTLEVVARFLALLELFREGLIGFEQPEALGELIVRWIAGDGDIVADLASIDEYDDKAVAEDPNAAASPPDDPADPDPADPAPADPAQDGRSFGETAATSAPITAVSPKLLHQRDGADSDDPDDDHPVNDSTGERDNLAVASGGASSDADV